MDAVGSNIVVNHRTGEVLRILPRTNEVRVTPLDTHHRYHHPLLCSSFSHLSSLSHFSCILFPSFPSSIHPSLSSQDQSFLCISSLLIIQYFFTLSLPSLPFYVTTLSTLLTHPTVVDNHNPTIDLDLQQDINEEWLSDKSRFACDGLKRQRLVYPMVKDSTGELKPCQWEDALMVAGRALTEAQGSVAVVAGGECIIATVL